jgi:hypothetical protein
MQIILKNHRHLRATVQQHPFVSVNFNSCDSVFVFAQSGILASYDLMINIKTVIKTLL